jgi:hypothetical protein
MSVVLLNDGRHAWVCHCIRAILMRKTKALPSSPDQEEKFNLLGDIFGDAGQIQSGTRCARLAWPPAII